MTTEEQVIWECFLMRRDRDLEWLWQKAQARDPLGRKFFDGIGEQLARLALGAHPWPLVNAL